MRRLLILILLVALCGSASAEMQLVENWSPSHPETQIYRDDVTGESLAVISSGPRYMAPGKSLTFGPLGNKTYWVDTGYYYCEYNRETGRTAVQEVATGFWTNWTPRIFVDNTTELSITGTPKLWDIDPYNPDNHNNVVDISYGPRVTRRIRVIEGYFQEYFIINSDPRGDLLIAPTIEQKDLPSRDYFIHSADFGIYDGFSFNRDTSQKLISRIYFGNASFPITTDDSFSNSTVASDGYVYYDDTTKQTYATIHNSATGSGVDRTDTTLSVYNTYTAGGVKSYKIGRVAIYFNTSAISSGSTITAANLSISSSASPSTADSDALNITSGQPTYPRSTLSTTDYDYTLYPSTTGGSMPFSSIPDARWNFTLSSTGLTYINTSGTGAVTKLFLRSKNDIASTQPTGTNSYYMRSSEMESMTLYVYYTSGGPSAPVASFSCTPTGGVRNITRTCTDSSTNTPTSWDWYGTGNIKCIGSNLTNQNPQLFPLNLSYCSLCLIATNAVGSDTECKNNYLWVMQPWVVGG